MQAKEKLKEVADEYAMKTAEILGIDNRGGYWVADDICIDIYDYGDTMFLSLTDMQVIVDHHDEWVKLYGKEGFVNKVFDWNNYCVEFEKNISLLCWLKHPDIMR